MTGVEARHFIRAMQGKATMKVHAPWHGCAPFMHWKSSGDTLGAFFPVDREMTQSSVAAMSNIRAISARSHSGAPCIQIAVTVVGTPCENKRISRDIDDFFTG